VTRRQKKGPDQRRGHCFAIGVCRAAALRGKSDTPGNTLTYIDVLFSELADWFVQSPAHRQRQPRQSSRKLLSARVLNYLNRFHSNGQDDLIPWIGPCSIIRAAASCPHIEAHLPLLHHSLGGYTKVLRRAHIETRYWLSFSFKAAIALSWWPKSGEGILSKHQWRMPMEILREMARLYKSPNPTPPSSARANAAPSKGLG
jgi:hypothetical protein